MLEESLRNFVLASYTNVGTRRATCGIVAGTVFFLLGCIAPIAKSFGGGGSRWLRLTALPGMWLGLTILFASLHGLCLSIYFFGDVRQLRKFELLRPPISSPVYKKGARLPITHPPHITPPVRTPSSFGVTPPPPPTVQGAPLPNASSSTSGSSPQLDEAYFITSDDTVSISSSTSSTSSYPRCATSGSIHISPQYYDEHEIEGPALCPVLPDVDDAEARTRNELYATNDMDTYVFPPPPGKAKNVRHEFRTTARFIDAHPYAGVFTDEEDLDDVDDRALSDEEQGRRRGGHRLRCESFDFEALPRSTDMSLMKPMRPTEVRTPPAAATGPATAYKSFLNMRSPTPLVATRPVVSIPEHSTSPFSGTPKSVLRWIQAKCTIRWRDAIHPHHPTPATSHPVVPPAHARAHVSQEKSHHELSEGPFSGEEKEDIKQHTRRRFRLARAVPAFASPLTRVLNPTVKRAQWEITVRSAIYAMIVSWVLLGGLVSAPET
jgi:hypothetical protein